MFGAQKPNPFPVVYFHSGWQSAIRERFCNAICFASDTFPVEFQLDLERCARHVVLCGWVNRKPPPKRMKNGTTNRKSGANGAVPTRRELLAAHERSIRRTDRLTAEEGFDLLVRAGIVTRDRKLTRRYGGKGENQPSLP